jgi:hypothetical protein
MVQMSRPRAVPTERRALLVLVALLIGLVAGLVVSMVLVVASVSWVAAVLAGGGAFVTGVKLALEVFKALALL